MCKGLKSTVCIDCGGSRDGRATLLLLRGRHTQPAAAGTTAEQHVKEKSEQPSPRPGKSLQERPRGGAQPEISAAGTRARMQLAYPTDDNVLDINMLAKPGNAVIHTHPTTKGRQRRVN